MFCVCLLIFMISTISLKECSLLRFAVLGYANKPPGLVKEIEFSGSIKTKEFGK